MANASSFYGTGAGTGAGAGALGVNLRLKSYDEVTNDT